MTINLNIKLASDTPFVSIRNLGLGTPPHPDATNRSGGGGGAGAGAVRSIYHMAVSVVLYNSNVFVRTFARYCCCDDWVKPRSLQLGRT